MRVVVIVLLLAAARPASAEKVEMIDHVFVTAGAGYADGAVWTGRVDQLVMKYTGARFLGLRSTFSFWGDGGERVGMEAFGFGPVLGWWTGRAFTTIGAGLIPLCIELWREGKMATTPYVDVSIGARLSRTLFVEATLRGERMLRFGAPDVSLGAFTFSLGRAMR